MFRKILDFLKKYWLLVIIAILALTFLFLPFGKIKIIPSYGNEVSYDYTLKNFD